MTEQLQRIAPQVVKLGMVKRELSVFFWWVAERALLLRGHG